MIVGRLGDGDPALSPSLGGGPLGADVFDYGSGNILARLRQANTLDTLLGGATSVRAIIGHDPFVPPGTPGGGGGADNGGGGSTDSPPGDAPGSGNPGTDGD